MQKNCAIIKKYYFKERFLGWTVMKQVIVVDGYGLFLCSSADIE